MVKCLIIKHKTPWSVSIPLREGEPYCTGCMQHVDACKCLVFIEKEVTEEEYEELMRQYNA